MKIIIKEIDKLISTLHKGRVITEYLIYLVHDTDGIPAPLEAYTEFGEEAKKTRVNELILLNFIPDTYTGVEINKDEIIQEINFEEYTKQLEKKWKNNTL